MNFLNIHEIQENKSNISNNSVYKKKKCQESPLTRNTQNSGKKYNKTNSSSTFINPEEEKYKTQLKNSQYNQSDPTADFKTINSEEFNSLNQNEKAQINDIPKSMKISNPENFTIIKEKKEVHNRLYEVKFYFIFLISYRTEKEENYFKMN
jgi:hypothetical protein